MGGLNHEHVNCKCMDGDSLNFFFVLCEGLTLCMRENSS